MISFVLLACLLTALTPGAEAHGRRAVGSNRALTSPTGDVAVEVTLWLPYRQAVALVRESGGSVHECTRLNAERFRCRATYWSVRHEAEEVEPGVWVEIAAEPFPEELIVAVDSWGVQFVGYPTSS